MNNEHINSHFCKCFVEVHVRDLFDNQEKKRKRCYPNDVQLWPLHYV